VYICRDDARTDLIFEWHVKWFPRLRPGLEARASAAIQSLFSENLTCCSAEPEDRTIQ
jgi:hypothetical protein